MAEAMQEYFRHFLALRFFPLALREAAANPNSNATKHDNIAILLHAYLNQAIGIGALSEAYGAAHKKKIWFLPEKLRGYMPNDGFDPDRVIEHAPDFPEGRLGDAFRSRLKAWPTMAPSSRLDSDKWGPVIGNEFQFLDRLAAEKIALLSPSVYPNEPAMHSFFKDFRPQTKLVFIDPAMAPDLYDSHYWFDDGHLNRMGATLYSRMLADSLCPGLPTGKRED
jgi:hypothetical protein